MLDDKEEESRQSDHTDRSFGSTTRRQEEGVEGRPLWSQGPSDFTPRYGTLS